MGALEDGRNFLKMSGGDIENELAGYGAGDKENFKIGAAQAMRESSAYANLARPETLGNALVKDNLESKLRPLFNSDGEFQHFLDSATTEGGIPATKAAVIGNSASAARLRVDAARNAEGGGGWVAPAIGAAAAFSSEPFMSLGMASKAISGLGRVLNARSPAVDAKISELLHNLSPDVNRQTLAQIIARLSAGHGYGGSLAAIPLAGLAGRGGPTIAPLAQQYLPQSINSGGQ
jgi:hypothetical protein